MASAPAATPFELHAHTTASDGILAPAALMERAAARGLRACAVTDHDTTGGHAEARARAAELGIELVPGIEASCDLAGDEVHILGLFVDDRDGALERTFAALRANRRERMAEMVLKLRALGLELDAPGVVSERGAAPGGAAGVSPALGRPHLARALVRAGHVGCVQEAFDRYLAEGKPAYMPKSLISSADGIAAIRAAGGIAVLAHPGRYKRVPDLATLVERGLGGVEVWYPSHTEADVAHWGAEAKRLGIIASGGSDFHGDARDRPDLGGQAVPARVLEELRRATGR